VLSSGHSVKEKLRLFLVAGPTFLTMGLQTFSAPSTTISNFTTSGATDGKERFSRE
jgi:hypothetical protein